MSRDAPTGFPPPRPSDELAPPPPPRAAEPSTGNAADDLDDSEAPPQPLRWRLNLALFVLTVLSVLLMGAVYRTEEPPEGLVGLVGLLPSGWVFALPLMSILAVHELGHYVAARIHRVDASLPYFIPLPLLSPFGTMGAVITMKGRIRSRNALLDIGASGPLAGLVVAIPVVMIGLALSPVLPHTPSGYVQEGQSLLYLLLKRVVLGPIPEGQDVFLHPTALAGWAGLLVTMINLLPWGQLDGGHVAYALFGAKQHRYARYFRLALLPLFIFNLVRFAVPVLLGESSMPLEIAIGANSAFWLVWFLFLSLLAAASGGADHPPTEPGELSPARRVVAWVTLGFFLLLFMPTPWAQY